MTASLVIQHSTSTNTTNGTGIALTLAQATGAGNILIATFSFDNSGLTTPSVTGITIAGSETTGTWVQLEKFDATSSTANGSLRCEVWGIKMSASWGSNFSPTATLSAPVSVRLGSLAEFSGVDITLSSTAGIQTSTTGTVSATTSGTTPSVGDLAFAVGAWEYGALATADSTMTQIARFSGGSTTSGQSQLVEYKVLTTAAQQSFSPVRPNSADGGAIVFTLGQGLASVSQSRQMMWNDAKPISDASNLLWLTNPAPQTFANTFEGGTNGTTISAANSGGASGDAWTTASGNPTYSTDFPVHGALGMKIPASNASRVEKGFNTAINWAFRDYIQIGSATTTYDVALAKYGGGLSGGATISNGKIGICLANGAVTAGTVAVALNQPVRIEGQFNVATGNATVQLFNNPDSLTPDDTISLTGANLGSSKLWDSIMVGGGSHTPNTDGYHDDVAINNTGATIGPSIMAVSKDVQSLWADTVSIIDVNQYLWNILPVTVTFTGELWEGGVFKASLGSIQVPLGTSTAELDFYWDASQLADPSGSNAELRLTSNRASDLGAVAWDAEAGQLFPVSDFIGLLWNDRTILSLSKQELWNINTSLSKSRQALWRLSSVVSQARQELWNGRAITSKSGQELWNDLSIISKPSQELWTDNMVTTKSEQALWGIVARVISTRQELWNTFAGATQSSQELWNIRQALSKSSQDLWNTKLALSQNRQTVWNVFQAIAQSRQELWLAKAMVSQSRQELWTTRQALTDVVQYLWTDNLGIADQITAKWNMGSLVPTLARSFVWNDLAALSKTTQEVWGLRQFVTDPTQVVWNDNLIVSDQATINWNSRAIVQAFAKSIVWNDLSVISASTQEVWGILAGLEKSVQDKWATLSRISDDSTFNWSGGGAVAVATELLWDLIAHRMVNVWLNNAWRQAVLRIWNGTEWNEPDIRIWNGSEWV